jgi:hypothetical protein
VRLVWSDGGEGFLGVGLLVLLFVGLCFGVLSAGEVCLWLFIGLGVGLFCGWIRLVVWVLYLGTRQRAVTPS